MHSVLIIDNVVDKPGFNYPCGLSYSDFRSKSQQRLTQLAQYLGPDTKTVILNAETQDAQQLTAHLLDPSYTGIILSGSPYSVDEEETWIKELKSALQAYLDSSSIQTPLLGICFGTQIIADLLGGKVTNLKQSKQGVSHFHLEDGTVIPSYVFHEDYIQALPAGTNLLASSSDGIPYLMQFEGGAWGVQTHPEIPLQNEDDQERSETFWQAFFRTTFQTPVVFVLVRACSSHRSLRFPFG